MNNKFNNEINNKCNIITNHKCSCGSRVVITTVMQLSDNQQLVQLRCAGCSEIFSQRILRGALVRFDSCKDGESGDYLVEDVRNAGCSATLRCLGCGQEVTVNTDSDIFSSLLPQNEQNDK